MTCEEARDRLLDAQRARLAPETRAALQTHLQTCAACAHEEAAEALGQPVGTVKSNVHRGLKLLRGDDHGDTEN